MPERRGEETDVVKTTVGSLQLPHWLIAAGALLMFIVLLHRIHAPAAFIGP